MYEHKLPTISNYVYIDFVLPKPALPNTKHRPLLPRRREEGEEVVDARRKAKKRYVYINSDEVRDKLLIFMKHWCFGITDDISEGILYYIPIYHHNNHIVDMIESNGSVFGLLYISQYNICVHNIL